MKINHTVEDQLKALSIDLKTKYQKHELEYLATLLLKGEKLEWGPGEIGTFLAELGSNYKAYKGTGISPILWRIAFYRVKNGVFELSDKHYQACMEQVQRNPDKYRAIYAEMIRDPDNHEEDRESIDIPVDSNLIPVF